MAEVVQFLARGRVSRSAPRRASGRLLPVVPRRQTEARADPSRRSTVEHSRPNGVPNTFGLSAAQDVYHILCLWADGDRIGKVVAVVVGSDRFEEAYTVEQPLNLIR